TPKTKRPGSKSRERSESSDLRARLMTGADLLNELNGGQESEKPALGGFDVGMTVRHPLYGLGQVVGTGGFAKHRTVTVEFRDNGRSETFVVSKCPLQPV